MSTPPLGVGYQDGGVISSQMGDPIVTVTGTIQNGTIVFSGYVGNWSQLIAAISQTGGGLQVQFQWYTDSTLAYLLDIASMDAGYVSTPTYNVIPNRGPYLVVTAFTQSAQTTGTITISPSTGVQPANNGFLSGSLTNFTGSVTTGSNSTVHGIAGRAGAGTLSLYAPAAGWIARLFCIDYLGDTLLAGTIQTVSELTASVSGVAFQPASLLLQVINNSGSTGTFQCSFTFDPY